MHEADFMTPSSTAPSGKIPAMKIAITGASGLIGSGLVPYLTGRGHTVSRIVRNASKRGPRDIVWSPERGQLDPDDLEGFDAVIQLLVDRGAQLNPKNKRGLTPLGALMAGGSRAELVRTMRAFKETRRFGEPILETG